MPPARPGRELFGGCRYRWTVELGRIGIWWSGSWRDPTGQGAEVAAEMEELGYGALWSSGLFEPGVDRRFERLLAATRSVVVGTGIVSVWVNEPDSLGAQASGLEARFPGRFLLGLGVSHAPVVESTGRHYVRPYNRMTAFLDGLEGSVPPPRRALAALGPRMLALAGARSLGAHPYFVPVEHTARARRILGPGPLLAPELAVVLERDRGRARELARGYSAPYLTLPNYVQNLRSLGFDEEDVAGAGSDRLVDAVVARGDEAAIADRVAEHLAAGADHVCVQVVTGDLGTFPLEEYRSLAPALADAAGR